MVTRNSAVARPAGRRGFLMVELVGAMALLALVLVPIAYSVSAEKRLARAAYQRAVAMEIVDGELEALAAGEWQAYPPGTSPYPARGLAATNLPPGKFLVTVEAARIRLEWRPAVKMHGGGVSREVRLP